MDRLRPVEAALLIGILSVVLNVFEPALRVGDIYLHVSSVDLIFFAVGLSALLLRWRESVRMVLRNRTYYLLSGLFLLSVLLSALLSPNPEVPLREMAQLGAYLWVIPLILVFSPDIPRIYTLGARLLVLLSSLILLPYFYVLGWVRFNPFGIHANFTGFLFALFTVLLAHYGHRWMSVLSAILTSFTFSRSALGSLFASFLFKGMVERGRRGLNLSMALLSVFLLFASPYALKGFLAVRDYAVSHLLPGELGEKRGYRPPIDVVRGKGYEIVRVLMWEASLKMWEKHRLTGIGLGRYRQEWERECKEGELPERLCVRWVSNVDPHNVFLQVLSETGIVGTIAFLLLFAFVALRVAGNPLASSVLVMTFLFALLQPFPLFTRNLAPLVWLLLFYGGVIDWREG